MPFDNATYKPLDRTRLAMLSLALRAPMPKAFTWDFGYVLESAQEYRDDGNRLPDGWCGSVGCAIGLAIVLWPDFKAAAWGPDVRCQEDIYKAIEMPEEKVVEIFFCDWAYDTGYAGVRPSDVADKIDEYLSGTKPMEEDSGR